jgi:hypothetical protein
LPFSLKLNLQLERTPAMEVENGTDCQATTIRDDLLRLSAKKRKKRLAQRGGETLGRSFPWVLPEVLPSDHARPWPEPGNRNISPGEVGRMDIAEG